MFSCIISDETCACDCLALPNVVCWTLTWPARGQPGRDPPPNYTGCGDTFKAQDPIVSHMMYPYVVEVLLAFCVITPSGAAVQQANIHHLFKSCLSSLEAVNYYWISSITSRIPSRTTSSITSSTTTSSRAASRTWTRSCPGKQCPASS